VIFFAIFDEVQFEVLAPFSVDFSPVLKMSANKGKLFVLTLPQSLDTLDKK
jgi:hypothetical protein